MRGKGGWGEGFVNEHGARETYEAAVVEMRSAPIVICDISVCAVGLVWCWRWRGEVV
jgi:hypothetical protein